MAWDIATRMKIGFRIRRLRWMLLLPIGAILLTQNYWQPHFENWRCGRIAIDLSEKYDLVVRYGDPSEFFVPPDKPLANDIEEGFFIGRTNVHSALVALTGVRIALDKYPHSLIKKFLKAVYISGIIKILNVEAGGTYRHSWIYISATPDSDPLGSQLYEKILHHELSSLLMIGANFPTDRWNKSNTQSFNYLSSRIDVVKAAEGKSRIESQDAHHWYKKGFVHEYGMSSINNDFNMYAELAMTHPQRLKELADQYPKIKAKKQILVGFYSSLAPELESYFKSVGLIDKPVKK